MKPLLLITGASTGIGKALCLRFSSAGFTTLAGVRKQQDFDSFKNSNNKNLTPVFLDVTNPDHIAAIPSVIDSHLQKNQPLILINNAGIAVSAPWELITPKELHDQFDINVFGTILVTQKCLPYLRNSRGRVYIMNSISGLFARPFFGPYATSKFALEAFADSLRRELKPSGVQVCSINPGPIKTAIWDKGRENPRISEFLSHQVYGSNFKKLYDKTEEKNRDKFWEVERLVNEVYDLVVSEQPPPRVLLAPSAVKLIVRLTQYLPTKWADRILERV